MLTWAERKERDRHRRFDRQEQRAERRYSRDAQERAHSELRWGVGTARNGRARNLCESLHGRAIRRIAGEREREKATALDDMQWLMSRELEPGKLLARVEENAEFVALHAKLARSARRAASRLDRQADAFRRSRNIVRRGPRRRRARAPRPHRRIARRLTSARAGPDDEPAPRPSSSIDARLAANDNGQRLVALRWRAHALGPFSPGGRDA